MDAVCPSSMDEDKNLAIELNLHGNDGRSPAVSFADTNTRISDSQSLTFFTAFFRCVAVVVL